MCRLPLLLTSRGTKAYRATPGISPGHPGRAGFETHKAVPLPDIFLAPPEGGAPLRPTHLMGLTRVHAGLSRSEGSAAPLPVRLCLKTPCSTQGTVLI